MLCHFAPSNSCVYQAPPGSWQFKRQHDPQDTRPGATVNELSFLPDSPLIQDVPAGVQAQGLDRIATHDAGSPRRLPRPIQSLQEFRIYLG
jgi:hypothetical protein